MEREPDPKDIMGSAAAESSARPMDDGGSTAAGGGEAELPVFALQVLQAGDLARVNRDGPRVMLCSTKVSVVQNEGTYGEKPCGPAKFTRPVPLFTDRLERSSVTGLWKPREGNPSRHKSRAIWSQAERSQFLVQCSPTHAYLSWFKPGAADAFSAEAGYVRESGRYVSFWPLRSSAVDKRTIKLEVFARAATSDGDAAEEPAEACLGEAVLSWEEILASFRATEGEGGVMKLKLSTRSILGKQKSGHLEVLLTSLPGTLSALDMVKVQKSVLTLGQHKKRRAAFPTRRNLFCKVIRASGLPKTNPSSMLSDPYVCLRLVPSDETGKVSTSRTSSACQRVNPSWGEAFAFSVDARRVSDLEVSVWDENIGEAHTFLGYALVPLETIFHSYREAGHSEDHVGESLKDRSQRHHYKLRLTNLHGPWDKKRRGVVHLSLWFGTLRETHEACRDTKRAVPGLVTAGVYKEPEIRTIHLHILKARGIAPRVLKQGSMAGSLVARSTYCSIQLTGCRRKNQTQIQKLTLWPEFNERFALAVAQSQLHKPHRRRPSATANVAVQTGSATDRSAATDRSTPASTERTVGTERTSTSTQRGSTTLRTPGNTEREGNTMRTPGSTQRGGSHAAGEGSESHRMQRAGFNISEQLSQAGRAGMESPILTIKLLEYDPLMRSLQGDKVLGVVSIPASTIPVARLNETVEPMWLPMKTKKGRKNTHSPELLLSVSYEEGDKLPASAAAAIGSFRLTIDRVYLEPRTAAVAEGTGGLYCVARYEREWLRSNMARAKESEQMRAELKRKSSTKDTRGSRSSHRSELGEQYRSSAISTLRSHCSAEDDGYMESAELQKEELCQFVFGETFLFPIAEPSTVFHLGLFDQSDYCLSTMQVRLTTLNRTRNQLLYPLSVTVRDKDKSEVRHVGYLELSIKVDYFDKFALWRRYFELDRPPNTYLQPLPWKADFNLKLQKMDILMESVVQGPVKLPLPVTRTILRYNELKFSVKILKQTVVKIKDTFLALVPFDLELLKYAYNPLTWDRPVLSMLCCVLYCLVIEYVQFILPLLFLALFAGGIWYRRFQQKLIAMEIARLSQKGVEVEAGAGESTSEAGLKEAESKVIPVVDLDEEEPIHSQGLHKLCRPILGDHDVGRVTCLNDRRGRRGRFKGLVEVTDVELAGENVTMQARVEGKLQIFVMRIDEKVERAKFKVEDRLEHVRRKLDSRFENVRLKLSAASAKRNEKMRRRMRQAAGRMVNKAGKVKARVGHVVDGIKDKAGAVKNRIGDALLEARKGLGSRMLAVQKRAQIVVVLDKYNDLKQKYEEMKAFVTITQIVLFEFHKRLQSFRGLLLWTDQRVSLIFVFGCFTMSMALLSLGLKRILQVLGLYILRPPSLRDPFPPLPLVPFLRLSSIEESPLWCRFGIKQRIARDMGIETSRAKEALAA